MDVSAQNNTKNATSNQSGPSSSTKAPRPDSLGFGIDPQQIPEKVAEKIQRGANILIALSKDPNLDEMSAAIALAIVLDQQKKHVTAIYSGKTPNALEFLKPEETFEKDTSSLQDFIIALNKSKADHLTYKLDGDYVKIYITPYKGQVKKEDLEYSYGDYNVDLVIVFNVNAGTEIDSALSEYGRIMHDASAINITSGLPGRFADLEWSDPEKSSVCEMVYDLLKELEITELSQEVATALLTGILSATERFSNNRTKPTTMAVASKLMEAGADQQLISANILKPETPATPENLATSDTSATPEAPVSSDIPATPEAPTSSAIPITSEIPTSSDTPTTAGAPATVDTPAVSDNPDTGLKELEELVNQNLAQNTNLQNSQETSSGASQLPNLPSEEPSLSATPLTTGNVMDELARMTASMTNTDQETNNLAGTSELNLLQRSKSPHKFNLLQKSKLHHKLNLLQRFRLLLKSSRFLKFSQKSSHKLMKIRRFLCSSNHKLNLRHKCNLSHNPSLRRKSNLNHNLSHNLNHFLSSNLSNTLSRFLLNNQFRPLQCNLSFLQLTHYPSSPVQIL